MAYGYKDDGTSVAVPTLSGGNNFTGVQTFTGTSNATSISTGTVVVCGGVGVQGKIYASQVYGSYWNDLVDCIQVPEKTELEYGYAYCFDGQDYHKSREYLEEGFIGIHSDTAGFYMGKKDIIKQMNVAVAGFVLAYVDQIYPVGTPLTVTKNGYLTKMKEEDLCLYPHKIVGTFWKEEKNDLWGPEGHEVQVSGRNWVKVV